MSALSRALEATTIVHSSESKREPWSAKSRGIVLSYGSALVVSALALVLSLLLDSQSQGKPLPEFLVAVAVAAWYGGFGSGLLAAALGALALAFFFDQPYGSLFVAKADALFDLVLMGTAAVLISWLTGSLRIARQRAAAGWAEAQCAARRAAMLSEVSHLLTAPLIDRAALQRVADTLVPTLADWCTFELIAPAPESGACTVCIQSDPSGRSAQDATTSSGDALACLPLVGQAGDLGTLRFGLSNGRRWDSTERTLAEEIGQRVALAVDNARLQAAERQARLEAEQLASERQAVLAHIADGVIVTGADGEIRFMNEAAGSLLAGVSDPLSTLELPVIAKSRQAVERREVRLSGANGELILACVCTPLPSAEANSGMVVTLRNVTAERRLEMQKQEFFANASHDLRTPVATIKASIEVVRDNLPAEFPAPLAGLLDNIDREADRMGSFVDDLLELARLEAGYVQLQRVPCDVAAIVQRSARAIEPLASRRHQQVVARVPEHPVPAIVDATRLERALMNLLSNAQKYGRDRGHIEIRLEHHPSTIVLAVQDDGPGISVADQPHIFERFFRAGTEDTRRAQGSGLGLPIARAMVELHGGKLTVKSLPGAGATFRIELPTAC